MKGAFWVMICGVMICGLMLSPACAQQQSQENPGKADNSRPDAGPSITPLPATASAPAAAAPLPPSASGDVVAIDSALQTQIQDALNKDPIFGRAGLKATASADGIELTGDVASGRDRLNAGRIAQSYAHGKKVVNHIVIKGPGAPAGSNPPENPPANLTGASGKSGSLSPP